MFVGAETVLGVSFADARRGLAAVVADGVLARASGDAYGEWGQGLARVGPFGSARGLSRLVRVDFRELVTRGTMAALAMRWEAIGQTGGLLPVLDADLTLAPFGTSESLLALAGAYRPPLGAVGAAADRVVLRRVAQATIQDFVSRIGDAVIKVSAGAEAV